MFLEPQRIGPKIGIDFRKARCVDYNCWIVLCASNWTHVALTIEQRLQRLDAVGFGRRLVPAQP
ncbi:MAG: hypothetical protein E5Y56_30080 [Mesorhizobium sp.]|nr:MAG: hypothetical protein E5Y56_30080 [Mesorhizobium sp.]